MQEALALAAKQFAEITFAGHLIFMRQHQQSAAVILMNLEQERSEKRN
jgi:hypothetical protein